MWIFPIIGFSMMLFMMYTFFGPKGLVRRFFLNDTQHEIQVEALHSIDKPEDILSRRYASGDITREEFLQMNHDLHNR
ncbi:MAG: hypothetical protein CVU98_01495 [Firmicutes bacterium HGW-Firmicutes-3]|nr:MAG: hypothetical protein CVU98_01495 [Firmicutes bacterium HGW-Firmicutes-3]